jgi:hypothetical protein
VSATFVGSLRSRPETIRLAPEGASALRVRVQMPEAWDAVRFTVSPTESAANLKRHALAALAPGSQFPEEFVLKLRGWEVLDETEPLADIGVRDGSILLLTSRRKRPIRRGG